MSNWLEFLPLERKPKTTTYQVRNISNGSFAGVIYWYGGFRKYVFQPSEDSFFDANCLQEISDFLNSLMEERKLSKKVKEGN